MRVRPEERELKAHLDHLYVNSLSMSYFLIRVNSEVFLHSPQGHTGLPGATGLQGLVGAKVIVLSFQWLNSSQQPPQLKKDSFTLKIFLKMAKTVLET